MDRTDRIYDARQDCMKQLETNKHCYERQEKHEKYKQYKNRSQDQKIKIYRFGIRITLAGLLFLFLFGIKTNRWNINHLSSDVIEKWIQSDMVATKFEKMVEVTVK